MYCFALNLIEKKNAESELVNIILAGIRGIFVGLKNQEVVMALPQSYDSVMNRQKADMKKSEYGIGYVEHVMCPNPRCGKLFLLKDCIQYKQQARPLFPKPGRARAPEVEGTRKCVCGTDLLEDSKRSGRAESNWKPIKTVHTLDLAAWIKSQFADKNKRFVESINQWKSRSVVEGEISDIYDAEYWKSLAAEGFFDNEGNLVLELNADWFTKGKDSIGVIMFAISNLPRSERFKHENMAKQFLPEHPSAETASMDSYVFELAKMLTELVTNGLDVPFPTPQNPNAKKHIHVRLGHICADTPAAAKLCGFLAHNAIRFCHCCNAKAISIAHLFPNTKPLIPGKAEPITLDYLKRSAAAYKGAASYDAAEKLASSSGFRWAPLQDIPHFNVIERTVIEPMHALFLNSAKLVADLFCSFFKPSDIDSAIRECAHHLPAGFPTFPVHFSKHIKSMTAFEMMIWTCFLADPVFTKLSVQYDSNPEGSKDYLGEQSLLVFALFMAAFFVTINELLRFVNH